MAMQDNDELKDILTESELAAVHSQIDRVFQQQAIYEQLRKRVDEAVDSEEAVSYRQLRKRVDDAITAELNKRAEQLAALRREAHRLIDKAESIFEGSLRIARFLDDKSSL
jgi:hypothetical protein